MGLLDAWPLDLPARDVLRLPEQAAIKWAAFDAAWYREAYPDAPDAPAALVLEWHIDTGQRLGRSPNRLFDELWHQAHHPALAARIANGEFASAFDAYCRRGCLDRSAHWLFDELAYRDRYPDLTNDVLRNAELANGYDHFLRHGAEEGRLGHPLFQPDVYLAQFDPADADAIRKAGVLQHYLARIETKEPELRTSVYFDPEWYVRRYPEVAAAISAGRWKSALHHYLCNDSPIEFDPNESFSESFYLGGDPGLREALKAGHFRNGYAHFLRFGAQELRAPSAGVDIAWYASQAAVKTDLEAGPAENAYAHWLTIGRANSLASTPPDEATLTEAQGAFTGTLRAVLSTGECL